MSGMGGRRMVEILSGHEDVLDQLQNLVLQPQREAEALRRWLVGQGWGLLDEEVIQEKGRFYQVMVWRPAVCDEGWTELDFRYGPLTLRNGGAVAQAWIADELRHLEENYASIRVHSPGNPDADTLQQRIRALQQILQDWR